MNEQIPSQGSIAMREAQAQSFKNRTTPHNQQQLSSLTQAATKQQASSPHNFHFFTQLPLEIRLMIIRKTFEESRRSVWITKPGEPSRYRCFIPPVSLFINQESRKETLRYFEKWELRDMTRNLYSEADPRTPYIYFNKSTDIVRTDRITSTTRELSMFNKHRFRKSFIEIMGQINFLEIEISRWKRAYAEGMEAGYLKIFRDLKELRLIPVRPSYPSKTPGILMKEREQTCIRHHKEIFERLAKKDPTRTVPKVVVGRVE